MPKPKWLGDLEQFAVAAPAAGASIDFQPPAGQVYLVIGFFTTFTCSAAVANRIPMIIQRGGINDTGHLVGAGIHAALSVNNITGTALLQGGPYNIVNYDVFPLGPYCYINNTIYLRLEAINQQAGDQWAASYWNAYRMLEE